MGSFRFCVGPVWAELVDGDAQTVDKLLAIPDPSALSSASVAARLSDGLVHFFDRERPKAFLAGLYPRLAQRLENRGHDVRATYDPDPEDIPLPPADCLVDVTLRQQQMDGLAAGLKYKRGVLSMATNAGKSEIIAALVLTFTRHRWSPHPGIVIAPNKNIMHELRKRFSLRAPSIRCGLLGDQIREIRNCDVVVATYQTLQQALGSRNERADTALASLVELAPWILVDEAHHAGGSVYQKLLKMAYNAVYRLGFTGSDSKATRRTEQKAVERSKPAAVQHKWEVESILGPVLHRTDNQEMVEAGYSAAPTIYVVDDRRAYGPDVLPPRQDAGKRRNPYNDVFELAVVRDVKFLTTVARVVRHLIAAGKPPFVFSHSVKHLEALSKVMAAREVPHKVLHGANNTLQRDRVVAQFAARKDFAVLCSSIFDEGANVPEIRAVVMAGARRAVVELLQRIGRGIRAKKDDNRLTVVDFNPQHCEMLKDHYEERRAVYLTEGFPVRRIVDVTRLSEVDL